MKKALMMILPALMGMVLIGCSAGKKTGDDAVMSASKTCSDTVLSASKGKVGTTKFTGLFLDDAVVTRVGDSSQGSHHIRAIPYVESSALDNGKPGSAWHDCMTTQGFNISG